jgi:hypothetical protein
LLSVWKKKKTLCRKVQNQKANRVNVFNSLSIVMLLHVDRVPLNNLFMSCESSIWQTRLKYERAGIRKREAWKSSLEQKRNLCAPDGKRKTTFFGGETQKSLLLTVSTKMSLNWDKILKIISRSRDVSVIAFPFD